MKSSRLLTAYFSPTGTTQKIAHTVAEGIAYPNQDIDLSIPQKMEEISEDTVLLAVVPVYGGRVPAVALKRMSQMRGNGQNAVAVAVYGNREFEDALLELKNTMEDIGFRVIAAAAFIAEHSIVRSIAVSRPMRMTWGRRGSLEHRWRKSCPRMTAHPPSRFQAICRIGNLAECPPTPRRGKPVSNAACAPSGVRSARSPQSTRTQQTRKSASPVCAA